MEESLRSDEIGELPQTGGSIETPTQALHASQNIEIDELEHDPATVPVDLSQFDENDREGVFREKEFITSISAKFLGKKDEWTLSNIFGRYETLCKKLKKLEKINGEPYIDGYLPINVVPHILVFVADELSKLTPEPYRLTTDMQNFYFVHYLKIQNPARFHPSSDVTILTSEDLLYPQFDHHWNRTLNDEQLELLQAQAAEVLQSDSIDPEVRQRCEEITNGLLPNGFNTRTEERWVMGDRAKDLVPQSAKPRMQERQREFLKNTSARILSFTGENITDEDKQHLIKLADNQTLSCICGAD